MDNIGVIFSLIILAFAASGIILGITNPQWLYNCVEGEEVYCYDKYSNPSQEKNCICENGDTTGKTMWVLGGVFAVIGFIMLIDSLNSRGAN